MDLIKKLRVTCSVCGELLLSVLVITVQPSASLRRFSDYVIHEQYKTGYA